MLKFLKMMVEAVKDVTITEEVVAEREEARADSAVEVVAEVLAQEKKVVSEAIEVHLPEKAVSEVTEMRLQEENRVLFKEKKERQDVLLKAIQTDRQDAHLKRLKTEDREKAKAIKLRISNCIQ